VKSFLVAANRAIFTAATAVLGVGCSLLAVDVAAVRNWTLVLGALALMYVGDSCADVERDARRLARNSEKDVSAARAHVFDEHRPRLIIGLTLLSVLSFSATGALFATRLPGDGGSTHRRQQTRTVICIEHQTGRHQPGRVRCDPTN
jgi:hypothetical protein